MYHDRVESEMKVQFHCYDIIEESIPFQNRHKFIRDNSIANAGLYMGYL